VISRGDLEERALDFRYKLMDVRELFSVTCDAMGIAWFFAMIFHTVLSVICALTLTAITAYYILRIIDLKYKICSLEEKESDVNDT
jgi:hypothetical protein